MSDHSGSAGHSPAPGSDELLAGLNEPQRRAASHRDGPMVVFAGAGSGKTRIISHRIAYLIAQGVKPWEILAVTFTNKATIEMRERVTALTPQAGRCLIATFHAACARWLREFAPELGFTADFTIYDDGDQLTAIKAVLRELNVRLDEETTAQEYRAAINRAKTQALLPSDERLARDYEDKMPPAGLQVYQRYQEYLAACNAMDFGDLIMNMLLLLRRNTTVREILQRRYQYLLVDEYQDTNRTQFELVSRLAEKHRNLFVVGDDDQSIYSWRGAMPANIIDFRKIYPDAVQITMEENYRCSRHIVDAASAMIAKNLHRVSKKLFTKNDIGDPITYRLETDNEIEAWYVTDQIQSEVTRFPYRDVAIFYRTNSQSRLLEDAMRRANIPYQIYGTVRFYDRAEIKDLLAYVRLLVNPSDDMCVRRIINVPTRGIGKKAEEGLEAEAMRRSLPLFTTLEQLVAEGGKSGGKLAAFLSLIEALKRDVRQVSLMDALALIIDRIGYLDYVAKKFPDIAADKIENIHELGAALAEFSAAYPEATLPEWLQSITLASSEAEASGGVSMMTLHMAKGLEFPRVYIVGLEEGLLPHRGGMDRDEGVEEERRLFYVGMTRAKQKLSLVGAYRRRTFQTWSANRPSRFLSEIPLEHFAAEASPVTSSESLMGSYGYAGAGLSYDFNDEGVCAADLSVGQAVRHPTYGKGVVEGLAEEHQVLKAVVRFKEFGLRKVACQHLQRL